ncbi:MAG TPA: deoxyhypusine synthase family protein [Candidatus Hydrogenedentes bacterium]|nr:deoxyhypusine synthase family protein [Candidatus Hydrogenedentota bacterium]HPG69505.1 deoxyhypusine synthase family protein [Candidatus Hydrogenedentota bacterium]
MESREYHNGREDGLCPLEGLDLSSATSFADLVRRMGKTAFAGRQLGKALDIVLDMTTDAQCRVVLTLSGAMTVAKQGLILCEMIDRGMVNAVISTGALIAHGLTESIGLAHYAVDPEANDSVLFAKGYNRIYDTLEMEANLSDVARLVAEVLEQVQPEDGIWSSARFCRAIGQRLDELDQGPGILRSAFRRSVPVFIPAFTDSEVGLDFSTWAMGRALAAGRVTSPERVFEAVPAFNPFLDLQAYARFIGEASRLGIFTVGGGVPRNWAQQVGPYYDVTAERLGITLREPRFQFGVRICPEPVHWGGLSGCTYSEGVSWGKFVPPEKGGRYAEVYADATLALPLLMKAAFEELDRRASP